MAGSVTMLVPCKTKGLSERTLPKHIDKCGLCQAHFAEAIEAGRRMIAEELIDRMVKSGELEEKNGMVRLKPKKKVKKGGKTDGR